MTAEEKLVRYAELKEQQKSIESEIKELSPDILEFIESKKVDKIAAPFGTFTISRKSTWIFSEKVKELQETEKATGVAKLKESPYLLFNSPKKSKEESEF